MNNRSVFINGNSFVSSFCLLLAIFGRLVAASNSELDAGEESLTSLTNTSTSTSTTISTFTWTVGHSCVNWTTAPEAMDGNCARMTKLGLVRCYGGMNNLEMITSKNGKLMLAHQMELCGWSQEVLNQLEELQRFPQLRSLTIEYGGFTEFTFVFPEMFHLQAINISWTNLSYISSRTFKRIYALKILDLRWNQLIQLDGPLILSRSFQQLYMAGNPWNCTRNFKWLLLQPEKGRLVVDRENLMCTDRKYKELQMLLVMHYKVKLRRDCQSHAELSNCTCLMHFFTKYYGPVYTVNCSHLQFHSLPSYLPENTTTLTINNNLISDINPLRDNPHYRSVTDVHVNDNRIANIDVLEDTDWLQNFRFFNLHGNRLRKFHVYALDNALNDNHNANILMLSQNPLHCTCKFGMRLREMLTKYKDVVRDGRNVTCTYMKGDELRLAKVLSLNREDICNIDGESDVIIHPIDLLNCIFASLIILILGKLAYDYYYYRYHGRVPWIVMKMP
ncbi:hypothetical protein ACLKA6_006235 [Drosophila palustris]